MSVSAMSVLSSSPAVDVVIAVHSATRPIHRAAASVLRQEGVPLRLTVVAHNIDPEIISGNLGELAEDPRLRLLHLADGIPSPAGPMNLGLAEASAKYVTVLGSDDEFQPGALAAWVELGEKTGAGYVLAAIRYSSGRVDPYPPVRCGRRTRGLHPVRDRLFYRSAPLGLVNREMFAELRFAVGLGSGEDLPYSQALFVSGAPLAYALSTPGYLVNEDETDRVTAVPRPVPQMFAYLDSLLTHPAVLGKSGEGRRLREALAVKLLRMHVFDAMALYSSFAADDLPAALRDWRSELSAVVQRIIDFAPGAAGYLSVLDTRALAVLRRPDATQQELRQQVLARGNYRHPLALLPAAAHLALAAQAPFRTYLAGALAGRALSRSGR